jgi:hypothetical protein
MTPPDEAQHDDATAPRHPERVRPILAELRQVIDGLEAIRSPSSLQSRWRRSLDRPSMSLHQTPVSQWFDTFRLHARAATRRTLRVPEGDGQSPHCRPAAGRLEDWRAGRAPALRRASIVRARGGRAKGRRPSRARAAHPQGSDDRGVRSSAAWGRARERAHPAPGLPKPHHVRIDQERQALRTDVALGLDPTGLARLYVPAAPLPMPTG